jgi:signal transduction histidine kinase
LLNLLTNAVKYNQRGGRVEIHLRRVDDDAVLEVSDTGRGIPKEALPRVFERFFRASDQDTRVGGTGLGLAIAKKITESHRGQIEVASELGRGTTFTVHLPLTVPPDTRPPR